MQSWTPLAGGSSRIQERSKQHLPSDAQSFPLDAGVQDLVDNSAFSKPH
jgi:hypothetical protein